MNEALEFLVHDLVCHSTKMSYWFPTAKYSMGKAKCRMQVVFFIIITAGQVSVVVIPYASLILNTP